MGKITVPVSGIKKIELKNTFSQPVCGEGGAFRSSYMLSEGGISNKTVNMPGKNNFDVVFD